MEHIIDKMAEKAEPDYLVSGSRSIEDVNLPRHKGDVNS